MSSRVVKALCLLACLGAILPVSVNARSRIISPTESRIKAQEDDNEKWEKAAKKRESELIKIADGYYKQKDYRKAADYYKRVVDLRYKRWDFLRTGDSVRPAYETDRVKLNTSNTRRARDRLDKIGAQIEALETAATKKELSVLFEKAEVEMRLGNVVEAYTIYAQVVKSAGDIGKKKYAVDAAIKAKGAQAAILKEVTKALEKIKKLLTAGKMDEATKSLDEFITANRPLILVSPELLTRVKNLREAPEFKSHARVQKAAQRLEMGNAAFTRGSYVTARRYYREVCEKYPETKAARVAEDKLVLMMTDPGIRAAMDKQEVDDKCAPLMARASALVKYDRSAEAAIIAEKIIADYPGTEWAIAAVELLKFIESTEPVTPSTE